MSIPMSIVKRISNWERRLRASYNVDLSSPENRRRARIYNLWFDHAILRGVWTNFHPVAKDVYRSNHPTHTRFVRLKAMGIKAILNLRGAGGAAHYLTEEESCRALGLDLVSVAFQAHSATPRADIQQVIAVFRNIERPFLMHCKSGADRAGFAAAIYLLVIENRSVAEARKMLSPRYLHLRWSKTGVLDHILDLYEARLARSPIGFEDWIATEYDHHVVQQQFNQIRKRAG